MPKLHIKGFFKFRHFLNSFLLNNFAKFPVCTLWFVSEIKFSKLGDWRGGVFWSVVECLAMYCNRGAVVLLSLFMTRFSLNNIDAHWNIQNISRPRLTMTLVILPLFNLKFFVLFLTRLVILFLVIIYIIS